MVQKITKTSEQDVDFGQKSGRASLKKEKQLPSKTLHKTSLDDGLSEENNEVVRLPVNAEKYHSCKKSVARYATLKLNRAQGSQVPRR